MNNIQNLDPEEIFALLFSSGMIIFTLIVIGIAFLIFAAVYVLQALAIYRMAKKVGVENAWGAWIPIFQTWVMFQISDKPFKILLFNKEIESRNNAFWVYMAVVWGGTIVMSAVGSLAAIPYVGLIFGLLSGVLSLAYRFAIVLFLYPLYHDIYEIFMPEQAVGFSVATIICSFVAPIVNVVLLLIASGKDPVLSAKNDYVVNDSEVIY